MKKLIAGVFAIAMLWTIWPYYALFDLSSAINKADLTGLERRVEWSSVRQGLRDARDICRAERFSKATWV